jgi:hypothetical protein
MTLSDLDRVREWGTWANVNREECDGCDLGMHLWDLRLSYARGGQFYNSYNWYSIEFSYMHDFLDALPVAQVTDPKIEKGPAGSITFTSNIGLQGINRIVAHVDLPAATNSALIAEVTGQSGGVLGFARAEGPFTAGVNTVEFIFANPFDMVGDTLGVLTRGTLSVRYESAGSAGSPTINDANFQLDLRRERTQSLWVIANRLYSH